MHLIRLDRTEREVLGRNGAVGEGVVQGTLPHVGQSNDTDLSVRKLIRHKPLGKEACNEDSPILRLRDVSISVVNLTSMNYVKWWCITECFTKFMSSDTTRAQSLEDPNS